MFPIVTVPETIRTGMAPYRKVFCRAAGFDHVGRYVTGLILSPKKTLQGIYDTQVWEAGVQPSRRAMHAAVFAAGWDIDGLLPQHRAVVAPRIAAVAVRWYASIGPTPIMIEVPISGA